MFVIVLFYMFYFYGFYIDEEKLIRVPSDTLCKKFENKSSSFTMTVPIHVLTLFVGVPACSVGYQSK